MKATYSSRYTALVPSMQIATDILLNSDYLDSLGIDEIVHILEGLDN